MPGGIRLPLVAPVPRQLAGFGDDLAQHVTAQQLFFLLVVEANGVGNARIQAGPLLENAGAKLGMADAILRIFLGDGFGLGI